MAFIDFSLDSRIRKKYVPLTTQQRFMRHVKRVAARNLCIPGALLQPLVDASLDVTLKNLTLDDQDQTDNVATVAAAPAAVDEVEESQALIVNLNIAFYFTIIHPPLANCAHCHGDGDDGLQQASSNRGESPSPMMPSTAKTTTTATTTNATSTTTSSTTHYYQQCNCNRVLYRSELVASANPSWKPFEGSTLCSPSVSHFTIRLYFVQLDTAAASDRREEPPEEEVTEINADNHNNSEQQEEPSAEEEAQVDDEKTTTTTTKNSTSTMKSGHQETENLSKEEEEDEEAGTLFLQWTVHLSGLICIGEEMPTDRRRLARNALLFGLHEGFYSALSSVASEDLLRHIVPPAEALQVRPASLARRSYCMNTLTRIQMMQYIIQATAVEAQRVRSRLEEAIQRTAAKREAVTRYERLRSSTALLRLLLDRRRGQLAAGQRRLAALEAEIFEVESETSSRVQLLKEQLHLLMQFRSERLLETRRKLELTVSALVQRRRSLAKVLFQDVYRIVPFPDARGFSICGVFLPDSEAIDQHDAKMVSVALGYVTHLVALLSTLLDVHLNYQLITFGSRSLIVDPNNTVLRESEKLLPLHSRSGRNAIFFKYGLYLLNRTIVSLRRSVGLKTLSVARTLANLYSLFTECLLVDNYNVGADMTLNRISPYSPSFDLLDPELVALSSGEAWNQHFLNDINFIKDNDVMNDCLWKEVEALTVSVALNRPMPLPSYSSITSSSASASSAHRSQLTAARTPSMTPSLAGSSSSSHSSQSCQPTAATNNTTTSSSSFSSLSSAGQQQQPQQSTSPYLEELRQSIARQRLYRRTASSQRLSQITASLGSTYGGTSSSAASAVSASSPSSPTPSTSQQQQQGQQQSRPAPPTVVTTVSSPEDIIRQPRNRGRGSSTNNVLLMGGGGGGGSPSSPSSLSSLMGLGAGGGSFLHHSNGAHPSYQLSASAAAQQRLQQLQQRTSPRGTFSHHHHQQHRRIRSISGYGVVGHHGSLGATAAASSSYSNSSTATARSFLHPLESSLNSRGREGNSSDDDPRQRKLSQPSSASFHQLSNTALLSCSLDKGLNRLSQLASSSTSSLNSSELSTNATSAAAAAAGNGVDAPDVPQHHNPHHPQQLLPSSYLNVEADTVPRRSVEEQLGEQLFNCSNSSLLQLETSTSEGDGGGGGGGDNVKVINAADHQQQRSWLHAAAESLEAATAASLVEAKKTPSSTS